MSDSLSELEGCDLLARLFTARGYKLSRNVIFREYGVTFHIDGWDAAARVGFEFLTSEDDDHDDLTLEGYKTLMAAQQRGELSLFILDEVETLSAAELTATAHEFLDEVAAAARARTRRGQAAHRKAATGRKSAASKQPAAKKGSKKPAKTPAGKKSAKTSAGKQPAGKKPRAAKANASKAPGKGKTTKGGAKRPGKKTGRARKASGRR